MVTTRLLEQVGQPEDIGSLRGLLAILLDAMMDQPEMLRALIEHTPSLGMGSKIADFEQRVGELAITHLRLRDQGSHHAETRIWIVVRAVEHLTIRYVLDRPPIDRDEFLDELTTLVASYMILRSRPEVPPEAGEPN